jgi:type I restriction enzyme S subunit
VSEWSQLTLGDLAEFSNGANFTQASFGEGIKIVGVGDFGDRVSPDWPQIPEVDPGAVTSDRQRLEVNDIVFVRSNGNPALVGRSMLITEGPPATHSAFTIRARPDVAKVDPRFLGYQLRHAHKAGLMAAANGTNITNLNQTILGSVPVLLPDMGLQRRIASILGAIDDLIEGNRRRIALLEEMARLIYQERFVHLRYPGRQDDELVDSTLGQIPEGWRVSTLGEQLSVLESGSRPRGGIDPNERGVPSIGAENILGPGRYRFDAEKYVSTSFYETMRRGRVEDGDVLLYKDGAHIGRHSLFRDDFPHSRCAINEHVFRLRARPPMTQSYLYFWIDRPETVEDIVSLNSNAAQPGLSQAKLSALTILVPALEALRQWDDAVEPLLKSLFRLARQNRTLTEMRELLLPGLVSGAIDVSGLDLHPPPGDSLA